MRKHLPIYASTAWGLALVLAGALILRLWALMWGLPLKNAHIDESVVLFYSLRVLAGDPNPQVFFDYPGFFLYLLSAVFQGTLAVARLFTGLDKAAAMKAYMDGTSSLFLVTARLVTVSLSLLTVYWVYRIGRKRGNLFQGLTASALLAVNRLHVLHSHYGTVDIAAVFLSVVAIDLTMDCWEGADWKTGLWASFVVGLAAATKYYPGVLGLFLLPAFLIRDEGKHWRMAGLCSLVILAGFAVGSPYSFLAWGDFSSRFAHLFPKIFGGAHLSGRVLVLPTVVH
ncbi:MAG: glycosyltransferase family 39 protein, partial [Elusimicrobia bacterium]|nr:glycosyltransferase family 39 protein [Elusimicrobiota bacterium]